jgi:alanine racemase
MDMCFADVTEMDVKEGDEVIVFGPEHPIELLAKSLNTIPYEILTHISGRVPRIFFES